MTEELEIISKLNKNPNPFDIDNMFMWVLVLNFLMAKFKLASTVQW